MTTHRPKRTHGKPERLPEPARSLGERVAKETKEQPGNGREPEEQASDQMDEWVASRAPGARPERPPT